jgi:hypothetical protein
MVKIILNKKETYNLRIDYDNITFGEFLELRKLNKIADRTNAQIAVLANMPLKKVNRLSPLAIEQVKPFLEFLEETETLKCKQLSEDISSIKIGDETWHKLEQVRMLLKDVEPLDVADKIVAIYVDIDLTNKLMPEAMGIINYFFCEIKEFFAKFVRLNDYKPTNDELMAGVKQLDYLGYVNTLDALAQGNLLNYDGILKTSADTVYTKLLKDFEASEYAKRLNKLKETK